MLGATFQQTTFDRTKQSPFPEFRRFDSRPNFGRLLEPFKKGVRAAGAGLFALGWTAVNLLARLGSLIVAILAVPLVLLGPAILVGMLVKLVSTVLGDPGAA